MASTTAQASGEEPQHPQSKNQSTAEQAAQHPDAEPPGVADWVSIGSAGAGALATVALAIFAVLQISIYRHQTRIMALTLKATARAVSAGQRSARAATQAAEASAKSVQVAERTLNVTYRPWLIAKVQIDSNLLFNENGAHLMIEVSARNSGNMPAVGVFAQAKMFPVSKDRWPPAVLDALIRSTGGSLAWGEAAFPSDPDGVTFRVPLHIAPDEVSQWTGETAVVGYICYFGHGKEPMFSKFAFELVTRTPDDPFTFKRPVAGESVERQELRLRRQWIYAVPAAEYGDDA